VTLRPAAGRAAGPADPLVEEIYFQQDKVIWSLGRADGLTDAWDAARSPDSRTFVADGSGKILCFDVDKNQLWDSPLPPAGAGPWRNLSVSLFEDEREQILVLVSAQSGRKNMVYVLDSNNGKIIDEKDSLGPEPLPALDRVAPQIQGMELMKK
jgi:hypothetical protein